MSSPKVSVPGPTPQETALREEQTAILKQQRDLLNQQMREQALLAPYIYKQAGILPQYDASGAITGFTEVPDTLKDLRTGIEEQFLKRSEAALKGELPVDPGLMRSLSEQEQALNETLRAQLGTGYATSTPGIEALQKWGESKQTLLDQARRGDLTMAEQLGIARQSANDIATQNYMNRIMGSSAYPFSTAANLGPLASSFGVAAQPYASDRQSQLQANIYNAQSQGQMMGNLFGGLGGIVGLGAAPFFSNYLFPNKRPTYNIFGGP